MRMKGTNRYIKALSVLLCLVMVLSYVPLSPLTAFAADNPTEKNITLGASHIEGAQASNVYFGNYYQSDASGQTKDPIKWRVLSNADGKLFLLSDQNLDVFEYHKEYEAVTWETSTMRSWLNGLANNKGNGENAIDYTNDNFLDTAFSASEQVAIADTTVVNNDNPSYGTEGGNNTTDKVFLLSIEEAQNTAYGFTNNTNSTDTRKATNTAYVADGGKIGTSGMYDVGAADYWWLRSPGDHTYDAAYVRVHGSVGVYGINVLDDFIAVRPAFNINLSSVLFTSAAKGGKSSTAAAGGGAGIFENVDISTLTDNDGYKLTLLDSSRNALEATISSISGNTVTVSYSDAKTGDNEYISAIIKNGSTVKYYGRLGLASESGTETVTLPDDFNAANGDVLCIFNEQYNGDYKTDYASELKEMPIYGVAFDANGGTGTMNSVIATGTYTLPANGFTAPLDHEFDAWSIGGEKKAVGDSITVSADTTVTAEWKLISPSYTVTIPATATPGEAFTVSADAEVLRSTQTLTVAITGTSGTDNAFTLKNAQNVELGYTLKNGETVIGLNDKLLALTDKQTGSVNIDIVPDQAKYSGDYTGTVIFTIALEEVVNE